MERIPEGQIFDSYPAIPTSPSVLEVIGRKLPQAATTLAGGGLLLTGIPTSVDHPHNSNYHPTPSSENNLVLDDSWQKQVSLPGADLFMTTDNVNGERLPVACIYFSKTGQNVSGSNNAEWSKTVPIQPQKSYTLKGLLHYITVIPTFIPKISQKPAGAYLSIKGEGAPLNILNGDTERTRSREGSNSSYVSEKVTFSSEFSRLARIGIHLGPAEAQATFCAAALSLTSSFGY